MLKPKTSEQISEILKYCNQERIAVVPQGGNTGLVGGSNPIHDEIIISLSRMNQVMSFDETYGILVCESGCILQDLQNHVEELDYEMPINLGSKGSCQIGGNLSTNAGGINFIKHNSLHANTIGLKTVLPNGDILDNITRLRKDNTGYDLKHLFIGAEGTLGIITEAAILCPPKPKCKEVAIVACASFNDVIVLMRRVKRDLSDVLAAAEFMDYACMERVLACH